MVEIVDRGYKLKLFALTALVSICFGHWMFLMHCPVCALCLERGKAGWSILVPLKQSVICLLLFSIVAQTCFFHLLDVGNGLTYNSLR